MRLFFFTALYLVGLNSLVLAQKLSFERIGIKQGLSQNTVRCVLQDSSGFLWVGTADGLNRFDGLRFKPFTKDLKNRFSLLDNSVTAISEGSEDRLWIGTRSGAMLFDKRKERFYSLLDSSQKNTWNKVSQILEDQTENCLWIATEGDGLIRLELRDLKKKKFVYYLPQTFPKIYSLVQDRQNSQILWLLGEKNTILKLDKKTAQIDTFPPPYEVPFETPMTGVVREMKQDQKGNLWVGSFGLSVFDTQKQIFIKHWTQNPKKTETSLLSNAVSAVFLDEENYQVWIGTYGNGLSILDTRTQTFEHYAYNPADGSSLSNDDVQCIYRSSTGLFWVGTYNGGLNKYDPNKNQFVHYKKIPNNSNSLIANNIRGILEDHEGKLWVGTTTEGLTIIDRKNNTYEHHNTQSSKFPLSLNRISAILEDKEQNIWVGTSGGGLNKITKNGIHYYYKKNEKDLNPIPNNVRALGLDSQGRLWVGGSTGLVCIEPKTEKITDFTSFLQSKDVKSLACDPNSHLLWVGTEGGGLHLIDLKKKTTKIYRFNPENPNSISSDVINFVLIDNKNRVWIGTAGGGLNLFDRKTEKFRHFTVREGLPNNVIYGILEDRAGLLWISTNQGLCRFDPKTFACRNFYEEDGLQSNEFNILALHKSKRTGELFFGGINGLNAFFSESLMISQYQPKVTFTDFKIYNESVEDYENSVLKEAINYQEEIVLSHEYNVFAIHFAALEFSSPEKVRYAYFLDGFSKNWTYTSISKQNAVYTNLEPETYIFRVKTTNGDGVWSPHEATLKITILPPIWQTWWFRVWAVIIVLLGTYQVYRWRVRRVEREAVILEKLVGERTAQLRQQQEEIIRTNAELENQKAKLALQKDAIVRKNEVLEKQKSEIENFYQDLLTLSEIGQEITNILDLHSLLLTIYAKIHNLMPADGFGVGLYEASLHRLVFPSYIEEGIAYPEFWHDLNDPNRFSIWCFNHQKELLIGDLVKEYHLYVPQQPKMSVGKQIVSLIYVPLFLQSRIIGVLTVQSFAFNAYTPQDMNMLKNLGVYISVAINNAQKYQELDHTKTNLEQKNRYILDSIRYAETIQQAILPSETLLEQIFGKENYFVIYKPKDIVSGDFYWVKPLENGRVYFAVVDCTGHGVPGAFMSMIGNAILTEILHNNPFADPAMALKNLHLNTRLALRQEERQSNDGMDIALCMWEGNQMVFSGAKLNVYHLHDQVLQEYKGDRKSLGGQNRGLEHTFTNTAFETSPNDQIFLLTDGFLDQSNSQRQRFGSANWRKLLMSIETLSCEEQKEKICQSLKNHQNNAEQRDDITVFGIRIS